MKYGIELIKDLERQNETLRKSIENRYQRIKDGWTDMDDCFVSQKCEDRGIRNNENKIELIKDGGCAWFQEYATLDGILVDAHWCKTFYGLKLKVTFPDGTVKWTTAHTQKGLAKVGIKKVECLRPAWYTFSSGGMTGMMGVYAGDYVLFPSDINYATGEDAPEQPIEMREVS